MVNLGSSLVSSSTCTREPLEIDLSDTGFYELHDILVTQPNSIKAITPTSGLAV